MSMPFWAFLHFYFYSHVQVECDEDCVNALLGFPSFLLKEEFEKLKIRNVSMPFWAFLHFYMLKFLITQFLKYLCQCPFGLSFISTCTDGKSTGMGSIVSMPFWAFLHFYAMITYIKTKQIRMCQCPSGLSFISTASFWNPQKQSIFQAFFAGIYLKILKKRFFRLFFVLFTICSYFNTNHSCT